MQIKAHELLKIIRKLKEEVKSKLKIAKTKRSEVKRRKSKLIEIEWKLRNMRATAVKIRDEELKAEEEKELQEYFNYLKTEVKKCKVLS
ncbi:hypothetical protein [Halanaerobium congolense]|uniref:Uncharacterized protein n=1 Tax=Halanaerobium congolense TaxID=54121 RepID=A0A1G6QJE1_9FIRM|nr:hypothetical protein [Halanaerobium congolense]SDC92600.1 hypothetical protein SAMN04488597_11855 [Halanaerobium congolense]